MRQIYSAFTTNTQRFTTNIQRIYDKYTAYYPLKNEKIATTTNRIFDEHAERDLRQIYSRKIFTTNT